MQFSQRVIKLMPHEDTLKLTLKSHSIFGNGVVSEFAGVVSEYDGIVSEYDGIVSNSF